MATSGRYRALEQAGLLHPAPEAILDAPLTRAENFGRRSKIVIQKCAQQHRVPLLRSQSFQRAIHLGGEASPQGRVRRQRRVRLAGNTVPEPPQPAHALQLPAGDGGDVEEPARDHGFLPQSATAPAQNKEHRARDLRGLGRITRPPKRRGMNEPQIAFDQRVQAIRIMMARPRFETFSIRGYWNCAAGRLQRIRRPIFQGTFSKRKFLLRSPDNLRPVTWFRASRVNAK